jgi:hypothetical protein
VNPENLNLSVSPSICYTLEAFPDRTFGPFVRVNELDSALMDLVCPSFEFHGVMFFIGYENLDANRLIMRYTVSNPTPQNKTIGISVFHHARIFGNDFPPCQPLPLRTGFSVGPVDGSRLTVVCRYSSYVTDTDTYWYGGYGDASANRWSQVDNEPVSNVDLSFAFS